MPMLEIPTSLTFRGDTSFSTLFFSRPGCEESDFQHVNTSWWDIQLQRVALTSTLVATNLRPLSESRVRFLISGQFRNKFII